MKAELISIKELLGMNFNIPYYQRGYRWEEKQVNDLLNDLQEFFFKYTSNRQSASYYCMQPLVVVKNERMSTDKTIVYDLIDGQQRLTTFYLLLLYLKQNIRDFQDPLYEISYERLDNSDELFNFDNLDTLTEKSKDLLSKFNDFFFLFRAYQTIKKWFGQKGHINSSNMFSIILGDGTMRKNQNDVRFLWYQPDQEIGNKQEANVLRGSIDIFNRLNYGQTPLSNTDLIKAMIMICDIYDEDVLSLRKEESSRYATEWDIMEKRLHNRLLWSMLVPADYQPFSRMELLFDYVAHDLYDNQKEEWESKAYEGICEDDKDFAYRVVSAYLLYSEAENVEPKIYSERVGHIWDKVQELYHMFCNWFNNRKTYHLIGLYILLHDKLLGDGKTSQYLLMKNLYTWYTSQSREQFVEYISCVIGEKVKIVETYMDDNKIKQTYKLENINYIDTPKIIIRILTLFNVHLTMNEMAENPLFDFELFKKTNPTSLEHIHPQNLKLDDNKINDWYSRRKEVLRTHENKLKINTKGPEKQKLLIAINYLDATLSKPSKTDREKTLCGTHLNVVDSYFDELANIEPEEMHTIRNMALVDGSVNSAFSNKLLNEKREIMYQKSEERTDEGLPVHYIMLGTRLVFNKVFTPKEEIDNMEFWGKKDREAYFNKIKNVYNSYIKQ